MLILGVQNPMLNQHLESVNDNIDKGSMEEQCNFVRFITVAH